MKNSHTTQAASASLGLSHGYRFTGDSVTLNSSFHAAHNADQNRIWSLRLVASPHRPSSASEILQAHTVTEIPLPPMSELTGAVDNFEATSGALPPAGREPHFLTLALLARNNEGALEVHDFATYEHPESFANPRFCDTVGITLHDEHLTLRLDCIENPRPFDNLSGTLSVEVWALNTPYSGGQFDGQPVAGAILGSLQGTQIWNPGTFELRAQQPASPAHSLVVMLREWNGAAFVTRDFVNFNARVATPVEAATAEKATQPADSKVPTAVASPTPVTPAATAAPAPVSKETSPTVTKETAAEKHEETDHRISINTAHFDVLSKIKGFNKSIATSIIAARPFNSLIELSKVKGIGAKTFEKIRNIVKL